jgi:hypothetical protein
LNEIESVCRRHGVFGGDGWALREGKTVERIEKIKDKEMGIDNTILGYSFRSEVGLAKVHKMNSAFQWPKLTLIVPANDDFHFIIIIVPRFPSVAERRQMSDGHVEP